MANVEVFASKEEIDARACLWVSRIDRGLSIAERDALEEWVSLSPTHRDSLEQMAALWDDMSVLNELENLFPLERKQATRRSSWRFLGGIAASFIIGVLIMSDLPDKDNYTLNDNASWTEQRSLATDVGQNQEVILSDGSVVQLNTNSRLSVSFTEEQRIITLHQGEAHFDVAHDVTRPFTVKAGEHSVTAVGTAFNVQMQDDQSFELLVTEGKVLVDSTFDTATSKNVRAFTDGVTANGDLISEGEKALVTETGLVNAEIVTSNEVSRELAWQRGMLVFQGEPLFEALQEVSRYTDIDFTIEDELIGKHRVAGYFRAGDIPGLLDTLKSNFNIRFYRTSPKSIVLTTSSS